MGNWDNGWVEGHTGRGNAVKNLNAQNNCIENIFVNHGVFMKLEKKFKTYQLSFHMIQQLHFFGKNSILKRHCISIFIAALFTVSKIWRQPMFQSR